MLGYIAQTIIFTSAMFWERPVDAKGRTKKVVFFFLRIAGSASYLYQVEKSTDLEWIRDLKPRFGV